jgi:hypothetical protein
VIPRLKDAVELTELASKVYANLDPQAYVGRLAPSLGLVMQKDLEIADVSISSEFLDPILFLSATHLREAIIDALRTVNSALQSLGGATVLSLTHAMGLGKTHFLTLLYHLYLNVPQIWDKVMNALPDTCDVLTKRANYRVDVAGKTLIIPIDLKYMPLNLSPYEALIEFMKKVLEKKRTLLERDIPRSKIDELYNAMSELINYQPKDASKKLCEILTGFGVVIPVLIIIDELYASIFEAAQGASEEYVDSLRNVLIFVSALVDELQGKEPVILVYASAQQDVERWSRIRGLKGEKKIELLKEAVNFFEDRMQRFSVRSVGDVSEDEALRIAKKRILRLKAPLNNILRREELTKLGEAIAKVIGEHQAKRFVEGLEEAYPFSPMYKEFVRKIVAPAYSREFSNVQHLRDLIKISSTVLGRAIDEDSWLVSIAHIEHDDFKHILDSQCAKEWQRNVMTWQKYIEERVQDLGEAKMLRGAIRSVYVKSVTDNIMDLIEMLSMKPENMTRDAIERRALSQRDLLLSLMGFVELDEFQKYQKVIDELERVPFIHMIDRSEGRYFLASLFSNPLQLISSTCEEELKRLKDEGGRLKVKEALDYVKRAFQQYALVSELRERVRGFEFVDDISVFDDERFLDLLNGRGVFTILTISPVSIAEELLVKGRRFDEVVKKIKEALEKNKSKIKYLNMFAIVIPRVDKEEEIERLVNSLVEIRASEKVLEMYRKSDVLDSTIRREIEQRKNLINILKQPEEMLRRIITDIMMAFKDRLQKFAQELTNRAVQNFASDLLNTFETIITYDPIKGSIGEQSIRVRQEGQIIGLKEVIASLPVWIVETVKGKLRIAGLESIRNELINWVKKVVRDSEVVGEELMNSGEYRCKINTIKEGLVRGWPDVPIKPLSLEAIEGALKSFEKGNGVEGRLIDVEYEKLKLVEVFVKGEDFVIKRVEVLRPPRPGPQIPMAKGFKILNRDGACTFLYAFHSNEWLKENVRRLRIELQLKEGTISVKGLGEKLLDLAKPLANYLERHRNEIESCIIEVQLSKETEEKEVSSQLTKLGLKYDELIL